MAGSTGTDVPPAPRLVMTLALLVVTPSRAPARYPFARQYIGTVMLWGGSARERRIMRALHSVALHACFAR